MGQLLATLQRTLRTPAAAFVVLVGAVAAALGTWLAGAALGGSEGYVHEVRQGCLLFAGTLALSLAEPLDVGRDARSGSLLLRFAKGGGFALGARWLGLLAATLPVVLAAAAASGGWPPGALVLLAEMSVVAAGGLLLGAFLDRGQLVPALWALLVAGHLRPWLLAGDWGQGVAWLLPPLGGGGETAQLLASALWTFGALVLADWRLRRLVSR